jgi:hypothetical protein
MQRIVSAHLKEDRRLKTEPVGVKRIYDDEQFSLHVQVFSGIPNDKVQHQELICLLSFYKEEQIEILSKFMVTPKPMTVDQIFPYVVERLEEEEKTPLQILRDSKRWCNLPFTQKEMAAFTNAGIEHHQNA